MNTRELVGLDLVTNSAGRFTFSGLLKDMAVQRNLRLHGYGFHCCRPTCLLTGGVVAKSKGMHALGWGATHLLAALAGWGLWTASGSRMPGKAAEAGKELNFRSHERGPVAGGRSAREILDALPKAGSGLLPDKVKWTEDFKLRMLQAEELKKRAAAVEVATDPAAAATGMLETYLKLSQTGQKMDPAQVAELEVRLLHWMDADPQAALAWFSKISRVELSGVIPFLRDSLDVMIAGAGVEEAGKWIGVNSPLDRQLTSSIADHAGAAADLAQLTRLKEGLDKQQWNNIRLSLINTWPMAKADDLFQLSQTENAPLTVLLYAKNQGPEGVAWLQKHLESAGIDPAFRASLLKHHDFHQLMYASPQMDLERRVEVVKSFEPGRTEEEVKLRLGVFDVVGAMGSGRDWRYAFRNGTATADEIYRAVAASLPELAAKSPEALKLQLFKELSEAGGARAMSILEDLPGDQKWVAAMKAPQWQFNDANPQEFHDFLRNIPADAGGPEVWATRLDAWQQKTRSYRARLGSTQYDDWVQGLPEGIDREMASYALLQQVGAADPELSKRLRGSIKNPQLIKQLEGQP